MAGVAGMAGTGTVAAEVSIGPEVGVMVVGLRGVEVVMEVDVQEVVMEVEVDAEQAKA